MASEAEAFKVRPVGVAAILAIADWNGAYKK
jgi:hypothetical protein